MRSIALLILTFVAVSLQAQVQYRDSLYSDISRTTFTYHDTLQFDFYRAEGVDGNIPLVVYVHGGGFSSGSRDGKTIVDFATRLASRGYAVASVSYTLAMKGTGFGCDVDAARKIATINGASDDVSMAVKYILEHNQTMNIDKDRIVISGSSAGAEVVLNMAYVYESSVIPSGFRYAGVISMAGAAITLDKINSQTAIPTQLFHGTNDQLVPYDINPHHFCSADKPGYLMLYGSAAIARRLKELDKAYYLFSVSGGSHSWAGLPMTKCFNDIVDFLYNDIVNVKYSRQTERLLK